MIGHQDLAVHEATQTRTDSGLETSDSYRGHSAYQAATARSEADASCVQPLDSAVVVRLIAVEQGFCPGKQKAKEQGLGGWGKIVPLYQEFSLTMAIWALWPSFFGNLYAIRTVV
jgi:hypothetical protein